VSETDSSASAKLSISFRPTAFDQNCRSQSDQQFCGHIWPFATTCIAHALAASRKVKQMIFSASGRTPTDFFMSSQEVKMLWPHLNQKRQLERTGRNALPSSLCRVPRGARGAFTLAAMTAHSPFLCVGKTDLATPHLSLGPGCVLSLGEWTNARRQLSHLHVCPETYGRLSACALALVATEVPLPRFVQVNGTCADSAPPVPLPNCSFSSPRLRSRFKSQQRRWTKSLQRQRWGRQH
jgi:hypothetical protein